MLQHGKLRKISSLVPPVVQDNSKTAYFLAAYGEVDWIARFKLQTSGADPATDQLTRTDDIQSRLEPRAPTVKEPNGFQLNVGSTTFKTPTVQIGKFLWNTREVKVGNFARWRLYRFSTTGDRPLTQITPSTMPGGKDHTFTASVAVTSDEPGAPAFVNFARTIPGGGADPEARVTMMMAVGPNNSSSQWRFTVVAASDAEHQQGSNTTCGGGPAGPGGPPTPPCFWSPYSSNQLDPNDNGFAWGFNGLVDGVRMIDWIVRAGQVEWN